MSGFDLENLETKEIAEEGATMVVHDIHGQPVKDSNDDDVYIVLAGMDSKRFKEASINARKDVLAGKRKLEDQDITAIGVYTRAACTLAWGGMVRKGEAIECNFDNAKALYEDIPALSEQVAEFMADRVNFIKSS